LIACLVFCIILWHFREKIFANGFAFKVLLGVVSLLGMAVFGGKEAAQPPEKSAQPREKAALKKGTEEKIVLILVIVFIFVIASVIIG